MNDLRLRERMSDLVETQPPMHHDATDDLRRARRSLATRRMVGAATAAVVVTVAAVAWPERTPSDSAEVAGGGLPESTILQRCQKLGAPAFDDHWGDGARLLTGASSAGNARAVLISADGERWADCWLRDDRTGPGSVATYAITGQRPDPSVEHHNGETGPRAGVFSLLERFPQDVARVSLHFDDGEVRDAAAVDGFVVFQLDDLAPMADLESVRLYKADGALVAGPGMAPGDADLPPAYRTLIPERPIASIGEEDGW